MPGVPVGVGLVPVCAGSVPVVPVGVGLVPVRVGFVPGGALWCRLVLVTPYDVSILTCFYE